MFKKKPLFIVFEGVEGCGKSYQCKKLLSNLKKKKFSTILTREPGGTKSAELIRNLILKEFFENFFLIDLYFFDIQIKKQAGKNINLYKQLMK